jgi:two-component system, cell cycle sensor histidine kinase and response regulator CckA
MGTADARKQLRILVVEDSEHDAELLLWHLRREGFDISSRRVDTATEMMQALAAETWDVVLSDYSMPQFSATAALALLRQSGYDTPFIIVSGTIGEETAIQALKAGANDYLLKGRIGRLAQAIEREVRDVTERRRLLATATALSDTRERMRFALEAAAVGTWESDVATGTLVWSDIQEALHGLRAGEFKRTFEAFVDLIHPDDRDRIRGEIARSLKANADWRLEYRVLWPDGSPHWIATVGRTFHGETGEPIRAAGVGMDVTALKRLEEQFRQAQKMEAVGKLAGGVAHDFNNLLTIILGYCDMLTGRAEVDPLVIEDTKEIRRAAVSASVLTARLLAFSRKQVLAPRVVNLNDILVSLQSMVRRLVEESVRIECRFDEDLARIKVDAGQMEQVLLNLVVNARDAMPGGGALTIETSNVFLDDDYVRSHVGAQPGAHVLMSVTDTGTGLAPDVQPHIFEPFFTTKSKGHGTGLGLATVYGIVKQSGGSIWVESEPAVGTTFKLYFPVSSEEPTPIQARAVTSNLRGSETVLVVEDEPTLRGLDRNILEHYGYRVLVAGDVAEALSVCASHADHIHVVVTDVVLPDGSGRTIGDWVLRHRQGTRVIYMSGYTDDAIVRHGILDMDTLFLQKPFTPADLARKVREILEPTDPESPQPRR